MSDTQRTVAQRIASRVQARINCEKSGNKEWHARHQEEVERLCRECMPSGSGLDNGTKLDFDRSTGERLIFTTAFHHMNEQGSYDGWTEHTVTVRPTFAGFELAISGRDRNDIKEYIAQAFEGALSSFEPATPAGIPKTRLVLVYQAGIANLFRVPSFDTVEGAERAYEGDFRTAEAMARGAALAGADVRYASCNRAGDIAALEWTRGLADCPFRDKASPVSTRER
jgi:hypothetical protein